MATITLPFHDCLDLPAVCIFCGEPATGYKRRTLTWTPVWVHLFLVVSHPIPAHAFFSERYSRAVRIECPVCDADWSYWDRKRRTIYRNILWFFLLSIIWIAFAASAGDLWLQVVLGSLVALNGLVSIVRIVVISRRGVRSKRITESDVTLTGVSDGFVAAFHARPVSDDAV